MKCPDIKQLEQYAKGELTAEQLVEMDGHISGCQDCQAALDTSSAQKRLGMELGSILLGVHDCLEYEELSAYVDGSLAFAQTAQIKRHINSCELCWKDVERLAELRSHAAIRERISVRPGVSMASEPQGTWFPSLRKILAGVSLAAVAAIVAISVSNMREPAKAPVNIARAPEVTNNIKSPAGPTPSGATSESSTVIARVPTANTGSKSAAPTVKTLLKDGRYSLVDIGGKTILAKAGGNSAMTALEARVAASIKEKLRSGKIRLQKPYVVAMVPATMRGSSASPSTNTAKLMGPSGKLILSSTPTLKWTKVDMAESYRVRVLDRSGQVVASAQTNGTTFEISRPLDRGKVYMWQVGVRYSADENWIESKPASFEVLSSDGYSSIEAVRRQLPGSHLALGTTYESLGLREEAAHEYAKVRSANRGSKLTRKLF